MFAWMPVGERLTEQEADQLFGQAEQYTENGQIKYKDFVNKTFFQLK